ncbi:MAG: hypothetical protein QOE70_3970 [Chthoniobacter sp.]|jgi:signal transduction histidine kinase|nr:hypothetical protein [Chthoniobacter sp.]
MFGSAILDVAIGLVFVYLLVSLIVSAVNELIASKLRWRAKDLWRGIQAMLESSGSVDDKQWTTQLYAHPLIRSLFPFEYQGQEATAGQEGKGPSYIPSRSFALALLDIAGVTHSPLAQLRRVMVQHLDRLPPAGSTVVQLQAAIDGVLRVATEMAVELERVERELANLEAGAESFGDKAANVAGEMRSPEMGSIARQLSALTGKAAPKELERLKREVQWLRKLLEELKTDLAAARPEDTAEAAAALSALLAFAERATARYLRRMLERLPSGDLRDLLLTLAEDAQGNLEKLKTGVEVWFNSSMDRVTGWYKKRTQWVHFGIAGGLAIFLNVDTLVVLRKLWSDGPLRQSLVAQAGKFAEQPATEITAARSLIPDALPPPPAPTDPKKPVLVVMPPLAQSGDSGATAKILVAAAAPAGGRKFTLSASRAGVLTLPEEMVVAEGKKESGEFALKSERLALGETFTITATDASGAESEPAKAQLQLAADPQKKYDVLNARIAELHLPIGWMQIPKEARGSWAERRKADPDFRALPDSELPVCTWIGVCLATILFHLLGWVLTAVAASLGAPFWFDLLNKIMNIRSTGKAPEEKPKDPKEVPQPREPGNIPAAR